MNRVVVRPATVTDAEQTYPLAAAFPTSFTLDRDSYQQTFQSVVTARDASLLVAELDGVLIGYLLGFDHGSFYANGPVAWVQEVMVTLPLRRQGVGAALMGAFEAAAAARGARLISLSTRRASAFYEALGYGESATYYRKVLPVIAP